MLVLVSVLAGISEASLHDFPPLCNVLVPAVQLQPGITCGFCLRQLGWASVRSSADWLSLGTLTGMADIFWFSSLLSNTGSSMRQPVLGPSRQWSMACAQTLSFPQYSPWYGTRRKLRCLVTQRAKGNSWLLNKSSLPDYSTLLLGCPGSIPDHSALPVVPTKVPNGKRSPSISSFNVPLWHLKYLPFQDFILEDEIGTPTSQPNVSLTSAPFCPHYSLGPEEADFYFTSTSSLKEISSTFYFSFLSSFHMEKPYGREIG